MAEEEDGNGASPPTPSSRTFDLPQSVLAVLPSDPFEQLDVARRITSLALSTRLAQLEEETAALRRALADRDNLIEDLRVQLGSIDSTLTDLSGQLARAQEEKEALVNENVSLSNAVKKLNRDVSKLEVFKKTLMQSLQEEDEGPQIRAPRTGQLQTTKDPNLSSNSPIGDEDTPSVASRSSSKTENIKNSDDGDSSVVDALRVGTSQGLSLTSQSTTPRLTPPDSPPSLATGLTPKRLSRPLSPRRHSISVTTTRNTFDERPSMFSLVPPSHQTTMTSPFDTGAQPGRTRVDGKEFFRQVRSRLSYEHFSAFLANVKELNSQKQTREETLRKAEEIFGTDNKDLYSIFEGLINRNLH